MTIWKKLASANVRATFIKIHIFRYKKLNVSIIAVMAKNNDIDWKCYFIYSILMGYLIN